MSARVLVALVTCEKPEYAANRKRCIETWGRELPAGYDFEVMDGYRIGCGDDYAHLSEKVKWVAWYAYEAGYDWLLKVDDDVWLRPMQLWPLAQVDYAGHVLDHPDFDYCAGGCYWLSSRACKIVGSAPLPSENTWAEDQWIGRTMQKAGGIAVSLPDFVLEPCGCGNCPTGIPKNWTAYISRKSGRPPRTFPPEHYPTY